MFEVTERASAQLAEMLTKAQAPDNAAIRFTVNGDRLEPRVDEPHDNDSIYRCGERIVLLVQPAMAEALANRVLDIEDSPAGLQLTIRNKEAQPHDEPGQ